MKYIATYILILFCWSKLRSQPGPPSLRCLEVVNSTGDVKLTWIPPSDPGGSFFAYEIYFSATPTGPFSQITTSLSPINTFSFVHSNTVSVTQSSYYYMRTRYGFNGQFTSVSSDTLRTIFLNINTSTPDALKITYNNVHQPKLLTTSGTFTISREYPVGTWNVYATTPLEIFNDTLDICSAKISYEVILKDTSGCISRSNINGGVYQDQHVPYQPNVDSISVLPNGNTVLAWQVPKDLDVTEYEIQQRQGILNTAIAQLTGRNTTFFQLSDQAAESNTVGLYVKAIDSCKGGSLVDYFPVSLFLRKDYDYCAFETKLRWNHYRWKTKNGFPTEEALEYRVYYSTDNGAIYNKIGSTLDTNFTHTNVPAGKDLVYYVQVENKRQTMTASSNRLKFYSDQVPAPEFVYIKTATIIKKISAEIQIFIDPKKAFTEIDVQKSKDGVEFNSLAKITYSGLANYRIEDENIETQKEHFYYRAIVSDSCGNIRLVSNTSRPILLKIKQDEDNLFLQHLSWTDYIGFSGDVKSYSIYRIVQDIGDVMKIGTTDSVTTMFDDALEEAASQGARIDYMVQANEGPDNVYNLRETSKSNLAPAYIEGQIYVPNAFAPSGVNTTWKPVTHFIDKKEYSVRVFNRWGEQVFQTFSDLEAWDGANCISDIYVYLITYKNSRGEYQELKGHVTLIR